MTGAVECQTVGHQQRTAQEVQNSLQATQQGSVQFTEYTTVRHADLTCLCQEWFRQRTAGLGALWRLETAQ